MKEKMLIGVQVVLSFVCAGICALGSVSWITTGVSLIRGETDSMF